MKQEKMKKTITISKADFDAVMAALQLTREEVGRLCNVSPHGVSWWRSGGKVPYKHLVRLAVELVRQLHGRPQTELDSKALEIFKKNNALSLIDAQGSAQNMSLGVYYDPRSALSGTILNKSNFENMKSAIQGDEDTHEQEPRRVLPLLGECKLDQFNQLLSAISLEDLLHEIGRRGFKVQIEPKE